jgi:hypothetical protein
VAAADSHTLIEMRAAVSTPISALWKKDTVQRPYLEASWSWTDWAEHGRLPLAWAIAVGRGLAHPGAACSLAAGADSDGRRLRAPSRCG